MKLDKSAYVFRRRDFGELAKCVEYRPQFSRLVTFQPNQRLPIHRWFYYKEGFSSELVSHFLSPLKNQKSAGVVFDPFCGVGTTLLTAKNDGFLCKGIDVLPLAVFISNVKLQDYENIELISNNLHNINTVQAAQIEIPERYYLQKAYTKNTLKRLFNIKASIEQLDNSDARNLAKVALLSICEETSMAKRDGGFLRFKKEKRVSDVDAAFKKKIELIIDDLKQTRLKQPSTGEAVAKIADARGFKLDEDIIGVVTSPPYLNRYDYTRNYALELTLEFVDDNELKSIRANTFKSHIESKSMHKEAPSERLHTQLELLRNSELSNEKIPEMVNGYFADLYATLARLYRYCRPEADVAFVLSTSRFSGVHFESDLILSDLGENLGFKTKRIIVAKLRGSSAQQSRRYGDVPLRESIVVFKR